MNGRTVAFVLLGATTVAAACSSAATGTAADAAPAADGCVLAAADTAYAARGPVFRDCAVDQVARALAQPRIDWRPRVDRSQRGTRCYTAEVQFVVGRDGQPEMDTARLLRASDSAWGTAVMASLPSWRYEPAMKDGHAVRQIVRERKFTATSVARVGETPVARPNC